MQVTAVGTISRGDDFLRLDMPGPAPQFILADGAKAKELSKQPDLLSGRVRVTGVLHPSHGDQPPGITVESWERSGSIK